MALDTTRFLAQVKMKASLPDGRYTDQEILDLAYDTLISEAQPHIISMREEYYTKKRTDAVTAGKDTYPLDTRALGLTLRSLKLSVNGNLIELTRIEPDDVPNTAQTGQPTKFYLQANSVVVWPIPASTSGSLIQTYFQRVSKPVLTTDCAPITAIDGATGVVTATVPTTWTTASTFDFVAASNGNDILARDLTATSLTSTTVTFALADLPSTLAVGDYLCLAGECPYVQVPDEAQAYVAQLTVCELLESMGSLNELQPAAAKAEKYKDSLTRIMSNRVQGSPKKFRPQML